MEIFRLCLKTAKHSNQDVFYLQRSDRFSDTTFENQRFSFSSISRKKCSKIIIVLPDVVQNFRLPTIRLAFPMFLKTDLLLRRLHVNHLVVCSHVERKPLAKSRVRFVDNVFLDV